VVDESATTFVLQNQAKELTEVNSKLAVTVTPNPATANVVVRVKSNYNSPVKLKLYTAAGVLLESRSGAANRTGPSERPQRACGRGHRPGW
jgi:hypothetical protein